MKYFIFLSAFVFCFILSACEEDFNPKSDFRERYILNLIIRPDTTVQVATLYRSYTVGGYDPLTNTDDPAICGADIRIIHDDKVFILTDTLKTRIDSSRYNTPFRFYYCRNFTPVPNKQILVRCQLPNGKILRATTMLPKPLEIESGSDRLIPVEGKSNFKFSWKKADDGLWYQPKLRLLYKTREGENYIPHTKEIYLMDKTGDSYGKPYSPSISRNNAITFEKAALDSAMRSIKNDNPGYTGIYYIYGCSLEVLIFDKNLSGYYSSIHGYLDNLSVRLDGSDYTNVEGGYGILGSYIKGTMGAGITEDYIREMGYSVGRK